MSQPPVTPCWRIHEGTFGSMVAAQMTWVLPKRASTEPDMLPSTDSAERRAPVTPSTPSRLSNSDLIAKQMGMSAQCGSQ